ncbi:MAG: GreA/GreB family elongation factor, partial [Gammaproteobacteria bacterium]|nr:GreA/GreB family elongation factor [Gammaproteobacteria bacterium]
QKRLDDLVIVDTRPTDETQVYFGAWVQLEDESGELFTYRIVGPDEFDPKKNWISLDSPMAKALLKKAIGDEIRVILPKGEAAYFIDKVSYDGEF